MKQNFTVRQGALDGLEAFLSVAKHRNFRKAAAELGVTPSAISQAVRALEARIGAALFIRTTRSVGLTEAGERFISRAKPAFEELVTAGEAARELGQQPAGLVAPLGAARGCSDPASHGRPLRRPTLELGCGACRRQLERPVRSASRTQSSIASTPSRLSCSRWSFMALSCSGECPFQSVTSPVTRSGSRERYDFVGLPGNFLSVRLGSSSIEPTGSTM